MSHEIYLPDFQVVIYWLKNVNNAYQLWLKTQPLRNYLLKSFPIIILFLCPTFFLY